MVRFQRNLEETKNLLTSSINDAKIVDKILIHIDDPKISNLVDVLSNSNHDITKLVETLLIEYLAERKSKVKNLKTKEDVLKIIKIPQQKFEELVRRNLIPHLKISNKIRLFDVDEVYKALQEYKVDELVSWKIPPVVLERFILQYRAS